MGTSVGCWQRGIAAWAAATAILAGCGSTVASPASREAGDQVGLGSAPPETGELAGATDLSQGGAVAARPQTEQTPGPVQDPATARPTDQPDPIPSPDTALDASRPADPPAPTGTADDPAPETTEPITLGFLNTKVGNAEQFGLNTGQTYTSQQVYEAAIAGLNAQGGLAGRLIEPVFADTDTASDSWASDYQAACAKFTQDNHVAAVLGYSFVFFEGFEACLTDAGVVHVNAGYEVGDRVIHGRHPYLIGLNLTVDRRYRLQLEGAVRAGVVTQDSRIGVLLGNCPMWERGFANGAEPYIQSEGLNIVSRQWMDCASGATDVGAVSAQIESAVLRFRTDGVDTVFTEGIPVIIFAHNAQSQGWHPNYVLTSTTGGGALEPNAPREQMVNMYGFGWLPGVDVNPANQPPPTAPQERCLELLASQGVVPSQYNDFLTAYTTCDSLFLYEAAIEATNGSSAPDAITRAIEAMGSSYASALTLNAASEFSADGHDAPAQYRPFTFDESCDCVKYSGDPETIH